MPNPQDSGARNDDILKALDEVFSLEEEARKGEHARNKLNIVEAEIGPVVGLEETVEETTPVQIPGVPGVTSPTADSLGAAPPSLLGSPLPPKDAILGAQEEAAALPEEEGVEGTLGEDVAPAAPQFAPQSSTESVSVSQEQLLIDPITEKFVQDLLTVGGESAFASASAAFKAGQLRAKYGHEIADHFDELAENLETDEELLELVEQGDKLLQGMEATRKNMIDHPVDAGRLLASPLNKVLAAIAAGLGGLNAPFQGGRNFGLEAVQQAIARDIGAQVARHEQRKDILGAKESEYTKLLDKIKDRKATIKELFSINMEAAGRKMEAAILESTLPDTVKAQMLEQVAGYIQAGAKLHIEGTKLALTKLSMLSKQARGGGSGAKVVGGDLSKRFDPARPVFIKTLRTGGLFHFSEELQARGAPATTNYLPEGFVDASPGERQAVRDDMAVMAQMVQELDDLEKAGVKVMHGTILNPANDTFIVAKQEAAQILASQVAKNQRISDTDVKRFLQPAFAAAIDDFGGLINLKDEDTFRAMVRSARKSAVNSAAKTISTRLPPGIEFRIGTVGEGAVPEGPGGGPTTTAPDPNDVPSFKKTVFDEIDKTAKLVGDAPGAVDVEPEQVAKWINMYDQAANSKDFLGSKAGSLVTVGRLGGVKSIENNLNNLVSLAQFTKSERLEGQALALRDKILRNLKVKEPKDDLPTRRRKAIRRRELGRKDPGKAKSKEEKEFLRKQEEAAGIK